MRVLVVSNLYPPHYIGGYELGCRDVVDGLRAQGFDVNVLCSQYGLPASPNDHTWRWLFQDIGGRRAGGVLALAALLRKEIGNRRALRRALHAAAPDVVYFWNLAFVSASMIELARRIGVPACAFVSDGWLANLEETDAWCRWLRSTAANPVRRAVKRILKRVTLRVLPDPVPAANGLEAQFASRFLKDRACAAGRARPDSLVIHWGVDTELFRPAPTATRENRRLLFVGQVAPHKGVHTAVAALSLLVSRHGWADAGLDVVGGTTEDSYVASVSELARTLGVAGRVRFLGRASRLELPSIYSSHPILVFPSTWDEPFSITILEAMASGIPVVSTTTGGSAEILHDGVNALVFPPGDAESCARQIDRLFREAGLADTLRASARRTVESSFRLERMIDRIATALRGVAVGCATGRPLPGPDTNRSGRGYR